MDQERAKNMTIIEAVNLNFSAGRKIIENVSFKLHKGEIITVIGPNGSGKTSLVKIILGLLKPDSGEVKRTIKMSQIGYMPQKIHIDQILPIRVIDFLNLMNNMKHPKEKIAQIIQEVGLENISKQQIHKISGGQMQRLLFANALLKDPELLVLDEPMQGVDIDGQIEFYALIEKIKKDRKISMLMISHDLHMVMKSTDYVICLNHHVCCQGHPSEIRNNAEYQKIFTPKSLEHLKIYSHDHDHEHGHEHGDL